MSEGQGGGAAESSVSDLSPHQDRQEEAMNGRTSNSDGTLISGTTPTTPSLTTCTKLRKLVR